MFKRAARWPLIVQGCHNPLLRLPLSLLRHQLLRLLFPIGRWVCWGTNSSSSSPMPCCWRVLLSHFGGFFAVPVVVTFAVLFGERFVVLFVEVLLSHLWRFCCPCCEIFIVSFCGVFAIAEFYSISRGQHSSLALLVVFPLENCPPIHMIEIKP